MLNRNIEKTTVNSPPIDGSTVMSSKIQGNTQEGAQKLSTSPFGKGYTIDEEGFLNRYAVETPMSEASYPSAKEQRRYLFLGIAAVLFIAFILELAFIAS